MRRLRGICADKTNDAHAGPCGEKASGNFLIEQGRLVDSNVQGVVIRGSGHWLMEEAPQRVIPLLVAFINRH